MVWMFTILTHCSTSTQVDEGTCGTPHLLEASGEGVHIYPNIHDRLLSSQAYEEYATVAVRALTGVSRGSPENATRLEEWIAKIRGTEFEAEAPLHALFTADAGDLDSMHCAEMTTATLQHMGLLSSRLVAGTAPPCAYADAPHGSVRLKEGQLGPLEILKAAEPPLEAAIAKYT